jgi:hypothetical protein
MRGHPDNREAHNCITSEWQWLVDPVAKGRIAEESSLPAERASTLRQMAEFCYLSTR